MPISFGSYLNSKNSAKLKPARVERSWRSLLWPLCVWLRRLRTQTRLRGKNREGKSFIESHNTAYFYYQKFLYRFLRVIFAKDTPFRKALYFTSNDLLLIYATQCTVHNFHFRRHKLYKFWKLQYLFSFFNSFNTVAQYVHFLQLLSLNITFII